VICTLSSWLLHVLAGLRSSELGEAESSGSCGDSSESGSMEKEQKWDNASMETVENQETALQWFMMGPPFTGWSEISLGARGESSGVEELSATEPMKAGVERCLVSLLCMTPPYRCLPSCALRLGWSSSQTLKHRNVGFFSEMWQCTVGNHENPLALICLSFPSENAE